MQVACASISVSDLEHPPVLSTSALPTWGFEMGNGELPTWNFELGNCPLAFWSGQCRAIAHHGFSGLVLALLPLQNLSSQLNRVVLFEQRVQTSDLDVDVAHQLDGIAHCPHVAFLPLCSLGS